MALRPSSATVKGLVRLRSSRRARLEAGSYMLVGRRLFEESVVATIAHAGEITDAKPLFYASAERAEAAAAMLSERGLEPEQWLSVLSAKAAHKAAGVATCDGFLCTQPLPQPSRDSLPGARWLVLDGISEPGNAGALLRTALGFGFTGVWSIAGAGNADLFNERAVSAAAGATLHLGSCVGFRSGGVEELQAALAEAEIEAFAAVPAMDRGAAPYQEALEGRRDLALVLGSEARGVSEEVLKISRAVCIPTRPECESLNVAVAGGVLMAHRALQ